MDKKLTFNYDQVTDILYINKCPPYFEQESEEIDEEIIARLNPLTGEIENLEILFFSAKVLKSKTLEIPIIADLQLCV